MKPNFVSDFCIKKRNYNQRNNVNGDKHEQKIKLMQSGPVIASRSVFCEMELSEPHHLQIFYLRSLLQPGKFTKSVYKYKDTGSMLSKPFQPSVSSFCKIQICEMEKLEPLHLPIFI